MDFIIAGLISSKEEADEAEFIAKHSVVAWRVGEIGTCVYREKSEAEIDAEVEAEVEAEFTRLMNSSFGELPRRLIQLCKQKLSFETRI